MEFPKVEKEEDHKLGSEHHDKVSETFSYPTMGIPVVGQKFNFTPVALDKLYEYDAKFMELF